MRMAVTTNKKTVLSQMPCTINFNLTNQRWKDYVARVAACEKEGRDLPQMKDSPSVCYDLVSIKPGINYVSGEILAKLYETEHFKTLVDMLQFFCENVTENAKYIANNEALLATNKEYQEEIAKSKKHFDQHLMQQQTQAQNEEISQLKTQLADVLAQQKVVIETMSMQNKPAANTAAKRSRPMITPASIVAKFPEFASISSDIIQGFIDDADLFFDPTIWNITTQNGTNVLDLGMSYWVASFLFTNVVTASGGKNMYNAAPYNNKSAGNLSAGFAVNSVDANNTDILFMQNKYGQMYLAIRNTQVQPMSVTGQTPVDILGFISA